MVDLLLLWIVRNRIRKIARGLVKGQAAFPCASKARNNVLPITSYPTSSRLSSLIYCLCTPRSERLLPWFEVAFWRLMIRVSIFAFYSFVSWGHIPTLNSLGAW